MLKVLSNFYKENTMSKQRNWVAKNNYHKPQIMEDRKRKAKNGKTKHKKNPSSEYAEGFCVFKQTE